MPEKAVQVMIVDDNDTVRRGLTISFEDCDGLELIGEAANGQQAVELAAQLQPDVILMDLMMPVMDGVTATRIIHQKFPHIKIIVLTSTVDSDMLQKAQRAGAHECLSKNITISRLEEAILTPNVRQ